MDIQKLTKNYVRTQVAGAASEVVMFPPNQTRQMLVSSEAFSVVDLLSEGPVGGVVDQNGAWAQGERTLCGVYINQVPVRETLSQKAYTHRSDLTYINPTQPLASDTTGLVSFLTGFDTAFRDTARVGNLDTIPDIDRYLASIATQINWRVIDLLKQSSENDDILLRGNTRFFGSNNVKYAFIPYTGINVTNLNLTTNNSSLRLMYETTGGKTGLLRERVVRNADNEGEFNKMMASQIPDPIINLAYGTEISQYNAVTSLRGGYIMLPLASGDSVGVSGSNVVFSGVDTGCVDPTSAELVGAKIFVQSLSENLANTYNYDKISVEMRQGTEDQAPLQSVSVTSRSYDTSFQLQGAVTDASYHDTYDGLKMDNLRPSQADQAYSYGSNQLVERQDFASWAKGSFGGYKDPRATYTHVIENPAVKSVSATFTLEALYDTVVTDDPDIEGSKAGTPTVALLEMGIEIGLEGDTDVKDPLYQTLKQYHKTLSFGIEGMVRGAAFRFRVGGGQALSTSWIDATRGSSRTDLKNLDLPEEIEGRKRYIKIYRRTPETFSSKRNIMIGLTAINEYYGKTFTYPLSALAGVSIDSRAFARVPSRAYDMRLKKVLIPSNYYPLNNDGTDKRFIRNTTDYDETNKPVVYVGDWDGTFRYAWTDNPAWIIYDMLVDPVYAIGNNMDDLRDINIWQLYEIGRFCDAVDASGYYVGVDDGHGGLEPRFSCNIVLNNEQDAYNIINSIATVFRGTCFYAGSDVDFYYDYEEEPIAFFNNANVDQGHFQYSDTLKSSRYTVVEVPYIDKEDNFLQKIEYFEDEESIQRYGYIKKNFEGIGITSRGQAQRFAKYALLSNKYETQTVNFSAGREALFLQPSDIIQIDDELKTLAGVGTYVADIDTTNSRLIIPHQATGEFDTGIYLYCATGENALDSIFASAYDSGNSISGSQITNMNTKKIKYFTVSSYGLTGTSDGGTGVVINLDTGQSGIDRLSDVPVGSYASIRTTGRDIKLYKVISLEEVESQKYEVSAIQYEPRKFAMVESGIKFSDDEDYFSNLVVDYNSNTPAAPSGVDLSGAASVVDGKGGVYVTGNITGSIALPTADQYECIITSPLGRKVTKTIANTGSVTKVSFGPFNEFGTYKLSAFAYGPDPLKFRSKLPATGSASIVDLAAAVYDRITIDSVQVDQAQGAFEAAPASTSGTGYFECSNRNINIRWTLKDRMGRVLSSEDDITNHWDNPKVDVEIRTQDDVMMGNGALYKGLTTNNATVHGSTIDKINYSQRRRYHIHLRVTGDSQTGRTTGIVDIDHPSVAITNWRVHGAYDSVSNGFDLWFDTYPRHKRTIEGMHIFTGDNIDFDADTTNFTNKFATLRMGQGIGLETKSANILPWSYYPEISNNTLISADSISDTLFLQGEKVLYTNVGQGDAVPNGLTNTGEYEMILGRTHGSLLYLDGRNGYWKDDQNSGFSNWAYLDDTGVRAANDAYYPFQPLLGTGYTSIGTGLMSGSSGGYYPRIGKTEEGVWIYNSVYTGAAYDSFVGSWVYSGAHTGAIFGDVAGNQTWTGEWAYWSTARGWVFIADYDYSWVGLRPGSSQNFTYGVGIGNFVGSGEALLLAEDRHSTKDDHSFFQQQRNAFTLTSAIRLQGTQNKMYLADFGGESGGLCIQLSGKQTSGQFSGSYRVDIRLAHNTGTTQTGGLITITGGSNVWQLGKWWHFGLTFYTTGGASANTGYAQTYVNGELHNSGSASGSGINRHYRACGLFKQFGQSVVDSAPTSRTYGAMLGMVADLGVYPATFTERQIQEDYYSLRNEYGLKLSTGDFMIREITGDNIIDFSNVRSLDNQILHIELGHPSGASSDPTSLVQKIKTATNMTGIAKQFTLQSNVALPSNDVYTNVINSTFYLDQIDYLRGNYVWSMIGNESLKMQYISGGAINGTHGRWIMYSGTTGRVLYHYTGASATDAGLLNTTSATTASGKVPVGGYLKLGESGAQAGLPMTPLPLVSSKTRKDGQSITFADIYMRFWPIDYNGDGWWIYPGNRDPAMLANFAATSDVSARTQAKGAMAAGEQLQYVIETMRAGATGSTGFQEWITGYLGGDVATISQDPITQEEDEGGASQTSDPTITSSLSYTSETPEGVPVVKTVQAYHPDPNAQLYISKVKSDVLNDPATNATGMTGSTTTKTRANVVVYDRDTLWITAKSAGLLLSNAVGKVVNIYYESPWGTDSL